MSTVGRQMQRSGSTGHHQVHHHHHRQYSDNFIDTAFSNKWLQSAGLHQLHSSNPSVPALQDFGFYGNNNGGTQGSVLSRSLQRGVNEGGNEDPWTPPSYSGLSSMMKNDIAELSPGLLDLHSFDTELIPEVCFPPVLFHFMLKCFVEFITPCMDITVSNNLGKAYAFHIVDLTLGFWYIQVHSQYTDDLEHCISTNNLTKGSRLQENNLLKSFSADRERTNNVAKIKVVVRKRPLNKKEISKKEQDIVTIDPTTNSLTVHETKLKVDLTEYVEKNEFVFDAVMGEDVSNDKVSILRDCGAHSPNNLSTNKSNMFCVWANRQVLHFLNDLTNHLPPEAGDGSGKTYTMQPLPLKASQDIFRLIHHNYRNEGYQLFVSFFEIYGGKVFDLLNDRKKLCMREDGKQQVCIVGLQEHRVSHVETVKELIEKGNATRSTGTTGANEESSRSHAILQLAIKRLVDGNESKPARPIGKLSFIDLAGSERGADTTDNDKQTRPPEPGENEEESVAKTRERLRWDQDDEICRGHILNGMSNTLFDAYHTVKTAKELWNQLERRYITEDATSKRFIVSKFFDYKMVDGRSVMEQFNEIKSILDRYSQHKLALDEFIVVTSIIDKLPPSWKNFRNNLKHRKEDINLDELGTHLRIEEDLRKEEKSKSEGAAGWFQFGPDPPVESWMEGAEINKSLLALKECIRALDNDHGHIPFRGSKLTEVLRDSFVGDSRTVMISCISPNSGSCEHTLNTLRYADRVKSLSKGNSSRKDLFSSSMNLRSSTALPSSSLIPTISGSKDEIIHDSNRFGWSKETERDSSRSFNMDHFPSGRAQDLVSTVSPDNKYQGGCQGDINEDDFELYEETYGQDKPFWMMNNKAETYEHSALEDKTTKSSSQTKQTDAETDNSGSHDSLYVLLQEEEDLIIAHRRQVEDTMITVWEEMNLLAQVDQPGNQLDDYLSRLTAILSQKAARISELKTRLGHFQRNLKDYKVLASSRH
ncbi:hypothetical protein RJ639_001476 [Escallonia herrerae]|uniref:Kinesin-like protein n=1 Tax=Escallonia herrerae TaxID=1293975 RepID=A0AA88X8R4_9ASTE|nr:hypothetical protein RJ639_001476 [Escallonia herrerae]